MIKFYTSPKDGKKESIELSQNPVLPVKKEKLIPKDGKKESIELSQNPVLPVKKEELIPEDVKKEFIELSQNPVLPVKRQLRGNLLTNYLTPLEKEGFSSLQKSILVGTLLGNATLHYGLQKKAHLKFEQKGFENQSLNQYIFFLYSVFSSITGTPPRVRFKNGKIQAYSFRTYAFLPLDFYVHQFYDIDALGNRKKRVPTNIHQWLNPIVLAVWFMDNGSIVGRGIHLHTRGLLLSDIKILQKAIGSVFHLETTIRSETKKETGKIYYELFISLKDKAKFTEIVLPYILPCKLHMLNLS